METDRPWIDERRSSLTAERRAKISLRASYQAKVDWLTKEIKELTDLMAYQSLPIQATEFQVPWEKVVVEGYALSHLNDTEKPPTVSPEPYSPRTKRFGLERASDRTDRLYE